MIQTIRERNNESAMMQALGFSLTSLIQSIFLESLILLSIGASIGSMFAYLLITNFGQSFNDFLPGVAVAPEHFLLVFALVNIAAAFCSTFPALEIKRIIISETLGGKA